jgi:tetratricopeptide (TPR) repeat protein
VERFPGYATAWGLLAQVDIDGVRFNFPHDPVASRAAIDRALTTARRAIELDPRNIRGLQAEMFGLSLNGEYDAARRVGEAALAINPNDTELMGEFGYRLALSGDWDKGCRLLSQARERISGPSAYYETALALCAYFKGDNTASVMWIRKTTAPSNPLYHLIAAAVYGEAGRLEDARASVKWLVENEPALASNARREVATRLRRSQDVEFAVGSLIKAGLDIPAEGSVLESGL